MIDIIIFFVSQILTSKNSGTSLTESRWSPTGYLSVTLVSNGISDKYIYKLYENGISSDKTKILFHNDNNNNNKVAGQNN